MTVLVVGGDYLGNIPLNFKNCYRQSGFGRLVIGAQAFFDIDGTEW